MCTLTVESDGERQLAQDSELSYSGSTAAPEDYSRSSQTVLVDDGQRRGAGGDPDGVSRPIGAALVVCQGGTGDVKLAVTEAVAALTAFPQTASPWQKSQ